MAEATPATNGGLIALLDVPPGSSITIDGVTRVTPPTPANASSSPLHRGLWIVNHVRSTSSDRSTSDGFHLLVVRSGSVSTNPEKRSGCRALPVGFAISPRGAPSNRHPGYEWVFARRYDPRTEEISNEPIDDVTLNNLLAAMSDGGELAKFIIPYEQFMRGSEGGKSLIPSWEARSSLIGAGYLQRRHGISHVEKLVPSSDGASGGESSIGDSAASNRDADGAPVSYPPIPCIDPTINARRLAQHSGTRVYLSKLPADKRTQLLLGVGGGESNNPGEDVWKEVLQQEYGSGPEGENNGQNDFLADIELSFLLTLFLECHASLEYWRDAVSMCSLATVGASNNVVTQHPHFFQKLLSIMTYQLGSIDGEFFQEVEYSGGEDNFLVGALRRLCAACEKVSKRKRGGDEVEERLRSASQKLRELVHSRFGLDVSAPENSNDDDDVEMDAVAIDVGDEGDHCTNDTFEASNAWEMSDEEDGPVVVPYEQIEASIERSQSSEAAQQGRMQIETTEQARHRKEYPLLYAAKLDEEDEVMACARILDEAKDVSLVREAAAYLEEVEAHRGGSMF